MHHHPDRRKTVSLAVRVQRSRDGVGCIVEDTHDDAVAYVPSDKRRPAMSGDGTSEELFMLRPLADRQQKRARRHRQAERTGLGLDHDGPQERSRSARMATSSSGWIWPAHHMGGNPASRRLSKIPPRSADGRGHAHIAEPVADVVEYSGVPADHRMLAADVQLVWLSPVVGKPPRSSRSPLCSPSSAASCDRATRFR